MEQEAQGFVEVKSYVAAIEAADAMAKVAEVVITMAHKVDGPDVCVICEGDVAACKAAVSAGEAVSRARGAFLASNIIPRPEQGSGQLYALMSEMQERKTARKAERVARREAVPKLAGETGGGSAGPAAKPGAKPGARKAASRKAASRKAAPKK